MSRRCDMLPHVGFCTGCKCKSLCRMRFKDVLSTFKMLDCFPVENPGCSRTDALTRSAFSGSRDVLGRPIVVDLLLNQFA